MDIVPEKVALINSRRSPIQDDYIEQYLAERELDLTATLDAKAAYGNADFAVIAAPASYDSQKNFFDKSAVENVTVIIYELTLGDSSAFFGRLVDNDLMKFKAMSDTIIANK